LTMFRAIPVNIGIVCAVELFSWFYKTIDQINK
jgi:hypothetical protein